MESIPDFYRVTSPGSHAYEISLDVQGGIARLTIAGSLQAEPQVRSRASSAVPTSCSAGSEVCADGVTCADRDGLDPILTASRMRAARGMPPIVIDSASGIVWQLIRTLSIGSNIPESLLP